MWVRGVVVVQLCWRHATDEKTVYTDVHTERGTDTKMQAYKHRH